MGISDVQLASMRAQVATVLPDSCVIKEVANVDTPGGGWTEGLAAVTGGTVNCRVDPVTSGSGSEIDTDPGRETLIVNYLITLPYDAPVVVGNRIVTGGHTYEIVRFSAEHSWNVSKRVVGQEIR